MKALTHISHNFLYISLIVFVKESSSLFFCKKFHRFVTPFPIITLPATQSTTVSTTTVSTTTSNNTIVFQNTTVNPAVTAIDPRLLPRLREEGENNIINIFPLSQMTFPSVTSATCATIRPVCPETDFIKVPKSSTGFMYNGCPCVILKS